MGSNTDNIVSAILLLTLISWSAFVASTTAPGMAVVDCTTITALISACSSFVTYGLPDPVPGSPCCIAMTSLNSMADTSDNCRGVCRCLMDLITTYNPNATAIATLPGFCGVSLGFTIDPNTDSLIHEIRLGNGVVLACSQQETTVKADGDFGNINIICSIS